MTTSPADTVLMDVEAALNAAESSLPTLLSIVGVFYAPAKALVPFLPLLQVVLTAVQQAQTVLDQDAATAVQTVTTAVQNSVPALPTSAPAVSDNPTA